MFGRFKEFGICYPNSGASASLSKDNWFGQTLESCYPHLFSFTKKVNCSLQFNFDNEIKRVFFLPLSVQASAHQLSDGREWDHTQDSWHYIWGPTFSSKKAYCHLQGTLEASPLFRWIWKSGNLGKH